MEVRTPIKIACIGNSITAGYGLSDRTIESYPAVLQRMLGDVYDVRNYGVSGTTVLRNSPAAYANMEEWVEALEFGADIVSVELGGTDLIPGNINCNESRFSSDYDYLIESIRAFSPKVSLYLTSLTPIDVDFSAGPGYLPFWHNRIQELITEIARSHNATRIDIFTPLEMGMKEGVRLFPDGIHPNKTGATMIAQSVYESIIK